jgi:hypothetical protein
MGFFSQCSAPQEHGTLAAGGDNTMSDPKKNKSQTKTGQVPRIDLGSVPVEPPQPSSIPEAPDPGGTTGIVNVIGEGEDRAKHQDDSASTNPASAPHPNR